MCLTLLNAWNFYGSFMRKKYHRLEGLVLESLQETRIKDRAKRALYKGFHNLRKMSYYLKVPVKTLGEQEQQKIAKYYLSALIYRA